MRSSLLSFLITVLLIIPGKFFSQKFGVNAGYVYGTFNPRITEDRSYFEQFEQFQNTFKRLHFPDAFVRPYVKIKGKHSILFGADIWRYKLYQHEHVVQTITYDNYETFIIPEIHFPLAWHYRFNSRDSCKLTHTVYAGWFYRLPFNCKEKIVLSGMDSSNGYSGVNPIFIDAEGKRTFHLVNFLAGYDINYKLTKNFDITAGLFVKYMQGQVRFGQASPVGAGIQRFPFYQIPWSFNFHLGFSFMVNEKKKYAESSANLRLED